MKEMCVCLTCGKEFVKKCGTNGLYCSRNCFQIERSKRMGSERLDAVCDCCGVTYSTTKYLLSRSKHHYCSKNCKHKHQGSVYNGENHGSWKGGKVEVECPICGKKFKISNYQKKSCTNNFCSRSCYGRWVSINFRGENSHFYVDGIDHINGYHCSFSLDESKSRIRKLFDNKCIMCGRSKHEHEKEIAIHHVYPDERSFKFEDTIYVCLCNSCHMKIHRNEDEWNYWTPYFIELMENYIA